MLWNGVKCFGDGFIGWYVTHSGVLYPNSQIKFAPNFSVRERSSILLDREEEVNEKNGARSMILHVGEFRIQVTLHHFDPSVRISRHPSDSLLRLLL